MLPVSVIMKKIRKIANPDVLIYDTETEPLDTYIKQNYGNDLSKISITKQTQMFDVYDKNFKFIISFNEEDLIADKEKFVEMSMQKMTQFYTDWEKNVSSFNHLMKIYKAYQLYGVTADKMPLSQILQKVKVTKKETEKYAPVLKTILKGE
jgi:Cu/Ag efflux pump CusA